MGKVLKSIKSTLTFKFEEGSRAGMYIIEVELGNKYIGTRAISAKNKREAVDTMLEKISKKIKTLF